MNTMYWYSIQIYVIMYTSTHVLIDLSVFFFSCYGDSLHLNVVPFMLQIWKKRTTAEYKTVNKRNGVVTNF